MTTRQISVKSNVDWKNTILEKLLLEKNQGANTTVLKIKYSDNGYPVLRAKNILENLIDYDDIVFVNKETFEKIDQNFKPKINDVLYTNIGSQFGNAAVVSSNKPFVIAWNIFRMSPNPQKIIPNFLAYLLNHNKANIQTLNSSSTMPFVSGKELTKFQFLIPSIPEQKFILKHLLNLDVKISNLQNQNRVLEQTAHAIFQSWFVDFDGVTEFEDSELGKIPKGWSPTDLKSVLSLHKDGSHNPPKRVESGIPFIAGASDVKHFVIDFSKCSFITKEDYDQIHKTWKIKPNDVLLTIVGTIGNVAIVTEDDLPFSLQRSLAVLRPNEKIDYTFLYFLLTNNKFEQFLYANVNPTGQPGIYLGTLGNFEFILPPKSLIEKFSITSKNIISILQKNHSSINSLKKTRDTLLPKLMSGEIRV